METFISHDSALEYWRMRRIPPNNGAPRRQKLTLPPGPPAVEQVRSLKLSKPIHIILSSSNKRRQSKTMRLHVSKRKADYDSYIDLGNGYRVSSPELLFMQMAEKLPLIGLIELGFELCGTYSLPTVADPLPPEIGFNNRTQLTNTRRLERIAANMVGSHGRKKALRALRYITDGSASPMETKLTILLILPYMLGGYGLQKPIANYRIIPVKSVKKSSSKGSYVSDLFWPDYNLAVEYDSDQYHTNLSQIAEDSKKRNALNLMGITVVTVTKQQLYSSIELEKVARILAKHLEKRLQFRNPDYARIRGNLRRQLFDS